MKKWISMILTVLLLCGCLNIAAHAEASKIDPELAEEMETLTPGETVIVAVWAAIPGNFKSSLELTEYVNRLTHEECGLTAGMCHTMEEVNTYSKIYNRILHELESANVPVVMEKLGLGYKDIIDRACNLLIVYLTKEEITAAVSLDEVSYVERWDDAPTEEPLDEPIMDDAFELLDPYQLDPDELKAKFVEWLFSTGRIGEYDPEDIPELSTLLNSYQVLYSGNHIALIYGDFRMAVCPWEVEYNLEIYRRVIPGLTGAGDESDAYPYYIYDKVNGVFKNIYDQASEDACDAEAVNEELAKALTRLKIGRPIGDADGDGLLDILDATRIQRVLVGLDTIADDIDRYWCGGINGAWKRYSDADGDGKMTILDATRIQRQLAGL